MTELTDKEVRDVRISENEFAGIETAIYARGTSTAWNVQNITINDNVCRSMETYEGSGVGVKWVFIDGRYIKDWKVMNNFLGNQADGTNHDGDKAITIGNSTRIHIMNNTIGCVEQCAIELANSSDAIISNNRMYNAGTRDMQDPYIVLYNVTKSTVSENKCVNDPGTIDLYAMFAVALQEYSNNNRVHNNFVDNVHGTTFDYSAAGQVNDIKDIISGTTFPSSGWHTVGTICYNSEPASTEPIGWVMVLDDSTYGGSWNNTTTQWKPFGTIN